MYTNRKEVKISVCRLYDLICKRPLQIPPENIDFKEADKYFQSGRI